MTATASSYSDKLSKVLHQKGMVSWTGTLAPLYIYTITCLGWRCLQSSRGQLRDPEAVPGLWTHRSDCLLACIRIRGPACR